ncbi:MAG: hypothetical protein IKX36_07410 [Prevotella sp.]|nr:hypothetical protein [Prevotella sp.]
MNKQTIITTLLALVAMAGQAKTYKTIKAPEAMACLNVWGELKAREVIMRDTATTVHFTMQKEKGQSFRFASDSYLMDEDGNRYPQRSCEGLKLDSWVQSPESGVTDFTMHFEPMPKKVQMFDFIEGDEKGSFRLLGIHDKKNKVKMPTLQELSKANPYSVHADWFKTDTITIRGRIEGYDAEKFGFTSMNCYYYNVFEKDGTTLIFNIAPDGTFEKKFQAYYPTCEVIAPDNSNMRFDNMSFFARPGETIDITIKPNEHEVYECYYNNGSSKEVERWLKADLDMWKLMEPISKFKGKISEVDEMEEQALQKALYIIQREAVRLHFTAQEMQLALANMQGSFIEAMANYIRNHKNDIVKIEEVDGDYNVEFLDSIEWKELEKMENYKMMQRVDYDNPLLMCNDFHFVLNRIQFAGIVTRLKYKGVAVDEKGEYVINIENEKKLLANYIPALRELMGTNKNNLTIQLCVYNEMMNHFDKWQSREALLSNMMPIYLDVLTNPYIHQKAEAFYARKMEQKEISAPLPADNPSAVLIRALCARNPGRYLMIDFWGMSCGPCRAAIQMSKELRAEIAKRDDVKLVFIAGERTTEGSDAYKKYVAEWLANEETVCVTNADFTRLQELFQFNSIPHYETITPDCHRVRDDLRINGYDNFDFELQRLKEKLK